MTIDEAIKYCEEVADEQDMKAGFKTDYETYTMSEVEREIYKECASKYRQLAEWLRELKRDREILNGLSIYFQSLAVDAIINQRPLTFDMRDATKEERESVKQYIFDSAKTTGVNFWSLIGEVSTDDGNNN